MVFPWNQALARTFWVAFWVGVPGMLTLVVGQSSENHLKPETSVSRSSQESLAPSQPPGWKGWPLSLLLLSLHVLGSQYSVALLVPLCSRFAWQ